MKLTGVTPRCTRLWNEGATALIGISPFNSYFCMERIQAIIEFCERDARPVALFIPNDVTRYTLQARGYTPNRAIRKTRRQVQYLRNKIARAAGDRDLRILGCEELAASPSYTKYHAMLCTRFETDADFRQGCLDTTRWVLAAGENELVNEQAALLGVRYLLAELPLFFHAPDILGDENVVFIYHQCPAFIASMYQGPGRDVVSPGQGFGVLQVTSDARRYPSDQHDTGIWKEALD